MPPFLEDEDHRPYRSHRYHRHRRRPRDYSNDHQFDYSNRVNHSNSNHDSFETRLLKFIVDNTDLLNSIISKQNLARCMLQCASSLATGFRDSIESFQFGNTQKHLAISNHPALVSNPSIEPTVFASNPPSVFTSNSNVQIESPVELHQKHQKTQPLSIYHNVFVQPEVQSSQSEVKPIKHQNPNIYYDMMMSDFVSNSYSNQTWSEQEAHRWIPYKHHHYEQSNESGGLIGGVSIYHSRNKKRKTPIRLQKAKQHFT